MTSAVVHITQIGSTARRALAATATSPIVVAALSRSLYLDVDGELIWLGPSGSTLHSRAMLAEDVPAATPNTRLAATIDVRDAREWPTPPLPRLGDVVSLRAGCRRFVAMVERLGPPDGFGALLVGHRLAFPLDAATTDARSFLEACAADDVLTAVAVGERLLGLGPGLTPAGDDLVGAAFFARRWLSGAGLADAAGWARAAAELRSLVPRRTNRISAVLLGDLFDGNAYAPLHDLATALAGSSTPDSALDAASRLTRIGHSSGWDMLAGFLGSLAGR